MQEMEEAESASLGQVQKLEGKAEALNKRIHALDVSLHASHCATPCLQFMLLV